MVHAFHHLAVGWHKVLLRLYLLAGKVRAIGYVAGTPLSAER
jgi:hypothetical protein